MKYQVAIPNTGLWQIPRQVAAYLIKLVSYGKPIRSFLDIGTCRGATITVVGTYLRRFGLQIIETVDIYHYVHDDLVKVWQMLGLSIVYYVIEDGKFPLKHGPYDVIFVDGHHDYQYVLQDILIYLPQTTSFLTMHDINDIFCVDVRRLWGELKAAQQDCGFLSMDEFTYHSHGDPLMGIGLIQITQPVPHTCPFYRPPQIEQNEQMVVVSP